MFEPILNRWRGTGVIFSISKINITGTMLYALYLGLLFGLLTNPYLGLIVATGFIIGESMGFGKWVGALCYPETKKDLFKEFADKEGYKFPYIHYIAETFIEERDNFFAYCNLALAIRGFIWGLLIYIPLSFDYISILELFALSLIYGIGFPFACWLSRKKSFNYESKFISIKDRWETQEVYYGFIHMLCNIYVVFQIML